MGGKETSHQIKIKFCRVVGRYPRHNRHLCKFLQRWVKGFGGGVRMYDTNEATTVRTTWAKKLKGRQVILSIILPYKSVTRKSTAKNNPLTENVSSQS